MSTVVELQEVSYAYGTRPAVRDVSLSIEAGEFLGLIGPNGSGKTTLLQLMLGLRRPDRGTVRLFGEPIESFGEGGRIGYVAQGQTDRGGTMPVTVAECVRMGRFADAGHRRLRDRDQEAVASAMETVDVAHLADRRPSELSGGQRQRTVIARALAADADLLALDEPTVGVDAESRDAFYRLLASLNDAGITIVLIEHDVGVVTDRADRIACINTELYHHGDTDSFVESDALEAAYGSSGRVVHHEH